MQARLCVLALVVCAVLAIPAPPDEYRKKLAGPPTEFADFEIPSPESGALDGSSAFEHILLTAKGGVFIWEGSVPVDSTTEFTLGIFSPYEDQMDIVLTQSNGLRTHLYHLEGASQPVKRVSPYGIDGATYPLTTWTWTNPTAGTWRAQIKCTAKVNAQSIKAILVVYNESPLKIFSHLNTYDLQLGQEIGVVANLFDSKVAQLDAFGRPTPMQFAAGSLSAQMDVVFPDGSEYVLPMHDDGLHADLEADDGIYGAVLQASEAGQYTAQALFKGVNAAGQPFIRSTEHLFNVINPLITLTGLATADLKSVKDTIVFHVDVDLLDDTIPKDLTVKAYAEVWGTDNTGLEYVPVAWIQSMVDPIIFANRKVITLQLDVNWLHLAQANTPLQLRNVWLEDRDYSIPYSERDAVFVEIPPSSELNNFRPNAMLKGMAISRQMREGPRPLALMNATSANPKLILVHGYCAGNNEFPTTQFANSVQFKDLKQSRTNDQFALKIKEFAESQGITSFGIVGHSQAGLASTHLHTYYFSGLEVATGGRLIQSVGSPYGGTALAGSLAGVGGLFGLGCGSNYDLTRDGAKLWSASIPTSATGDVDFYLTQYGNSGYCAWGANMVLDKPNDGTTEVKWGTIKGANNKGVKSSWCHTTGMTSPNQCTDPDRNGILNRSAAR